MGSDASSKPATLSKKLNGSASQIWALLRFLPVIIANKVNTSDPVWNLILQLRDITEYTTAPKLSPGQVICMKSLIDEYLEDRKTIFPNENLKPKHHFLHHY